LILAGGLVTSKEAGLAVPDWPMSYGQWFPPIVGNVAWEHGHRIIAGFVGILTLSLSICVQIFEKRPWLKRLAWIAFAAVILQAVLGGITVLFLLPPAVSIFHACLAQTFLCLIVALTYFLNPHFSSSPATQDGEGRAKLKRLSLMTTGFIYLQLILGAVIRHTDSSVVPHIVVAVIVVLHVSMVVSRVLSLEGGPSPLLRRSAIGFGILTIVQVFLGFGSLIFTKMLEGGYTPSFGEVCFTAAHQTVGALILALGILITLVVTVQPRHPEPTRSGVKDLS